ncbi:MAG: HAD family hydrolase [Chitinophagia bacterium]|nr:HAD family hydrolase [Chitinophagia bacterium]
MVVFDMAGTSVDEGNVVYRTLHKAIEKKCPTVSFEDVLKWGAGKEKLQAIRETLSGKKIVLNEQAILEIFQDFLGLLDSAYENLTVIPTRNTERLFKELRDLGIKVVLNTGYNKTTANLLVKKLNWEEGRDFDLLVTSSDVNQNRPNPDMILFAMDKLNVVDAATVIKVGDSTIDIEEGRNAGCIYNIGVTTGAHSQAELLTANPDYIFDDIYDLKALVIS